MPLVIAHGGVSGAARRLPGLNPAPSLGRAAETAIDAVEAMVRSLEDRPEFNAGYGATLTSARTVELDAGMMDGATGQAGGVAGVTVRNPVSLARRVMERTPHLLMIGEGAMSLAEGMDLLEDTTPEQHQRWLHAEKTGTLHIYGSPDQVDTVGAVALDERGRLAAASSTGGVFGKLPGRVGDAPIIGAGLYASHAGAAVGTGVGEVFQRTLACREVVRLIEEGSTAQAACEQVVKHLQTLADVTAGILAIDAMGNSAAAYSGACWRVETFEGPLEARRIA